MTHTHREREREREKYSLYIRILFYIASIHSNVRAARISLIHRVLSRIAKQVLCSGELAQMVERSLSMREVRGSMPRFSKKTAFDWQETVRGIAIYHR